MPRAWRVAERTGTGAAQVRLVPDDDDVTIAQGRSRPAWAEIDLAAITHNAQLLARLVAAGRDALAQGQQRGVLDRGDRAEPRRTAADVLLFVS